MVGTIVAVWDTASEEVIASADIAKKNPYQDLPFFISASSGSERVVAPGDFVTSSTWFSTWKLLRDAGHWTDVLSGKNFSLLIRTGKPAKRGHEFKKRNSWRGECR